MKQFVLTTIIAAFSCVFLLGQTMHLDVMLGSKKIGDINATATKEGKDIFYEMTSKVQVKIMLDVLVESKTNAMFKDGKLLSSKAFRRTNMASENKETMVKWNGKKYEITRTNEKPITLSTPIYYCVTDLYYREPIGQAQVFSEAQGMYLPLTTLPNHQYQLQVNDNKKDVYSYLNGKLTQVETTIAMRTVLFVVK